MLDPSFQGWGRLLAGARKSAASVSVIGIARSCWVNSSESQKGDAWHMNAVLRNSESEDEIPLRHSEIILNQLSSPFRSREHAGENMEEEMKISC